MVKDVITKDNKSSILAFRISEEKRGELLKEVKPHETTSVFLRRIVDTFLSVNKRSS